MLNNNYEDEPGDYAARYREWESGLDSLEAVGAALPDLANIFGVSEVSYVGVNLGDYSWNNPLVLSTFSEEWIAHYKKHNFELIDPVIQLGSKRLLPLMWSEISRERAGIFEFFQDAMSFGIPDQGVTVPIRAPNGEAALFTLCKHCSADEFSQYAERMMPTLQTIGTFFQDKILNIVDPNPLPPPQLSKNELLVLNWAAEGKTIWETGQILRISERKAKFYMQTAMTKLNSHTKSQAIAKAMRWYFV